jgi:transposase
MPSQLSAREFRGLQIAALEKLVKRGLVWLVPSESGQGGPYEVSPDPHEPHCTCPDHETNGARCKHIIAVEHAIRREAQGSTALPPMSVEPPVRKTYPQNWRAYNAAQTHEKRMFRELLRDLCRDIKEPVRSRNGRPRLPIEDAIFCACYKVYSTVSGRRFMSDLRDAHSKGFINTTPHFNTIFNHLEDRNLTPILRELIMRSSLPLKDIETDFAVDSSGFSTSRFVRWFDQKYGAVNQERDWVKVHLMCGVRTNVVTAVEIKGRHAADTRSLPYLVELTAANFAVREVAADKAYASTYNFEVIDRHGATPFIPFKSNHTGRGSKLWEKMYLHFQLKRDDFLAHYHKRSNVESTFSMIKAKFRDHVRSRTPQQSRNHQNQRRFAKPCPARAPNLAHAFYARPPKKSTPTSTFV